MGAITPDDRVILIADDESGIRQLVRLTISSNDYTVLEAEDGERAWTLIQHHRPGVAVLDVNMPGRSGLELIHAIKADPALAGTRVILLTGESDAENIRAGIAGGSNLLLTKPFSPRELLAAVQGGAPLPDVKAELTAADPVWTMAQPHLQDDLGAPISAILESLNLLDDERVLTDIAALRRGIAAAREQTLTLAQLAAAREGEHRARELAEAQQLRAVEDFRRAHDEAAALAGRLDHAYLDTITTLARAIEARDGYTGGHVERVRHYSLGIARTLGLGGDALRQLEFGAVLHDVGKIGVPDAVLRKPGPLDAEEWRAMRAHPEIGRRVLEGVAFLAPAIDAVAHHHERWDGRGYPAGLAGAAVPLAGRIVAVGDAFDAMASERPYRAGLPLDLALAEIERGRGTQFDPEIAAAFLEAAPRPG
jgi:response regulator RpfG family c-di-GMP phosphodiesterase